MSHKAVFLDRDNTLIDDPGYLADPDAVRLLPGVELALKSLEQAGFHLIVVTNQSGIARGLLTEDALQAIHERMVELLARKGAHIDEIYYCPYYAEGTVAEYSIDSDLRKPNPGMLLQACEDLDIDLATSWMVGDSSRDIEAGQRAGCRTIRIRGSHEGESHDTQEAFQADYTVRNLVEAARTILRETGATRRRNGQGDDVEVSLDTVSAAGAPEPATGVAVPPVSEPQPHREPEPEPIEEPPAPADEPEVVYDEPEAPPAPEPIYDPEPEPEPEAAPLAEPSKTEPASSTDQVRHEILRELRQYTRGQMDSEEFSAWRLISTIAQLLVFFSLAITLIKLLGKNDLAGAGVWATITVALQTMALTLVLMQRRR